MHDLKFDDLTRLLAIETGSRRRVLRVAAGGLLTAALARLGLDEAAARCAKAGGKCKRTADCCDGTACKRGRCRCAAGRKDCDRDGVCETDPLTDPRHCGACNNPCGVGRVCQDGRCVCEPGRTTCGINCCRSGATCCGDRCADLTDDPDNCGACGARCGAGRTCLGGSCCVPLGGACADSADCCDETPAPQVCLRGTCRSLRIPQPK